MSSTLPAGTAGTTTAVPQPNDVYSRMLKSAVEAAIEEVILVDEQSAVSECTCGQCGTEPQDERRKVESARSDLGGAPFLYIETRIDSDPIVLDEHTIAADIERIAPRWVQSAAPDEQVMPDLMSQLASFDARSFDPFDPGIIQDPSIDI